MSLKRLNQIKRELLRIEEQLKTSRQITLSVQFDRVGAAIGQIAPSDGPISVSVHARLIEPQRVQALMIIQNGTNSAVTIWQVIGNLVDRENVVLMHLLPTPDTFLRFPISLPAGQSTELTLITQAPVPDRTQVSGKPEALDVIWEVQTNKPYQFYTDFSENPAGQPLNWNVIWSGVNYTVVIRDNATARGQRVLETESGTSARRATVWQRSESFTRPVEILTKVSARTTGGFQSRPVLLASGGPGTETAYFADLMTGNTFRLLRYETGAAELLGSVSFTWLANTFYWIRLRADVINVMAKIWRDGTTEPGPWTIVASDINLTTGQVGVGGFSFGLQTWDAFSVSTQGPAPSDPIVVTDPPADIVAISQNAILLDTQRFITNFSEYPAGQPNDWSQIWQPSNWTVEPIGDSNVLAHRNTTTQRQVLVWNRVGEIEGPVEVVAAVTSNSLEGNQARVHLRTSIGPEGQTRSYFADLVGGFQFAIRRYDLAGTFSPLVAMDFSWSINLWYWIRFRATDTQLLAKVWQDGQMEPVAFQLVVNENLLTSGFVGVGGFTASGIRRFARFGVGLGGQTAPTVPSV